MQPHSVAGAFRWRSRSEGTAQFTSNDTAEFLWPALFRSIGTIGHEMMCAAQSFDKSLAAAEYEMMDRFVSKMGTASLLCDLVDAETVGLENALRVIKSHLETDRVGVRVDSGDIAAQCVLYYQKIKRLGIPPRAIVFEDEVTPEMVNRVYNTFREQTGLEPTMLFPGAGGYWWKLVHRDTVSAAFKRTATEDRPNVKFSNSPGKETIPGYVRVYARGDTLVVADKSEPHRRRATVCETGRSGANRVRGEFPRASGSCGEHLESLFAGGSVATHHRTHEPLPPNACHGNCGRESEAHIGECPMIVIQPRHGQREHCLFAPDGSRLASGAEDGLVKMWNPAKFHTGKPVWEVDAEEDDGVSWLLSSGVSACAVHAK